MIRALNWMVGFWLALLFIVGQGSAAPQWIVWLNGLAALLAFLGGVIAPTVGERARIAGPIALSLGVLGLWIAGLATHSVPWLPWCNFLGGITLLSGAIAAATFPEKRAIPREAHHRHA